MQRHALNSVAIGNFKLFGWNKSNKNDKQKRDQGKKIKIKNNLKNIKQQQEYCMVIYTYTYRLLLI